MAKAKYYIEDYPFFNINDEEPGIEELTKEEFTESLNYNIEVAFEYGDSNGDDFETFKNKKWQDLDYYGNVDVNGFTYSIVITD